MKKLATVIGALICVKIMGQAKSTIPVKTINNYFIKSGGCSGSCGGHCSCGKH